MARRQLLRPILLLALGAGCASAPATPTPLAPLELVERFVALVQDPSRTLRYTVRLQNSQSNVRPDGSGQLIATDMTVEVAGANYRALTHTRLTPPMGDQAVMRSELALVEGVGYSRDVITDGPWAKVDIAPGASALERLDPFGELDPADLEYAGLKEGDDGLHVVRLGDPHPLLVRIVGVEGHRLERLEGDYTAEFYVTATGVPVGAYVLVAARLTGSSSLTGVEADYVFTDWGSPIVVTAPTP